MNNEKTLIASHQERLFDLGYYRLKIDGLWGIGTENAFTRFKEMNGLRARPLPGPLTCALLWSDHAKPVPTPKPRGQEPLWLAEARSLLGTREVRGSGNNPAIMKWAKDLDLWYSGDDIPWCGLFVAHCMAAAGMTDPRPSNPLGARNWLHYGVPVPFYPEGGIAVFWRTHRTESWHGHVSIITGHNETHIRCIGGNQSDNVTEAWFPKDRLLGVRGPTGWTGSTSQTADTGLVSHNEH